MIRLFCGVADFLIVLPPLVAGIMHSRMRPSIRQSEIIVHSVSPLREVERFVGFMLSADELILDFGIDPNRAKVTNI